MEQQKQLSKDNRWSCDSFLDSFLGYCFKKRNLESSEYLRNLLQGEAECLKILRLAAEIHKYIIDTKFKEGKFNTYFAPNNFDVTTPLMDTNVFGVELVVAGLYCPSKNVNGDSCENATTNVQLLATVGRPFWVDVFPFVCKYNPKYADGLFQHIQEKFGHMLSFIFAVRIYIITMIRQYGNIGKETCLYISGSLVRQLFKNFKKILTGHSLGAFTASYVGSKFKKDVSRVIAYNKGQSPIKPQKTLDSETAYVNKKDITSKPTKGGDYIDTEKGQNPHDLGNYIAREVASIVLTLRVELQIIQNQLRTTPNDPVLLAEKKRNRTANK